jgi:hypothetical protein
MAKLTLLEITQKILSAMDSDDVNSISDTEESLQVVDIIEDTYNDMMSSRDWPHLRNTCMLESLGDTSQPTTLKIPDVVSSIEEVKYNTTVTGDTNTTYTTLIYKDPQDFLDNLLTRNTSDAAIEVVSLNSGTPIWVWNDKAPRWYTSFDDEHIVFDAYNSAVDSTAQGSKSLVHCYASAPFTKADTFVADLPEKVFPLLLAESKRACFLYLKQQDSPIDAKRSLSGRNRMKDKSWRAHDGKRTPNFGRK